MEEIQKLDNQLCFALYVCSKEIIKKYKPLLEPFGLTYTGYITMLVLWEKDGLTVKELGERLFLDSGTLTPVLKKLEASGFVERNRNKDDERSVTITLTAKGKRTQESALSIPKAMGCAITSDNRFGEEEMKDLLKELHIVSSVLVED
ncbi:transcriptional regulator [Sphaerochaeta pleomorpha str. Grapes]|uniref:Transcriptional regulator n=1 Tax=Sphaerochaeta pleomorpha (strain ATCC BAA-1885 / DSM 22778 / Grapes) TaxID=158190 RepID=G8QTC8_SPHPG|nr:MarR family winged helix-turn-helix transcriptional regulator [Sphaerochaeta pleomorpha]AEV29095.1 transcriptional regulator [Sphaerochaeta pleomorpha str. Grapes]